MQKTVFEDLFSEEVWSTTYKDHSDKDINDTMMRVSTAIASVEKTEELRKEWSGKFYDLLTEFKGVAGGRIYANAGTEYSGTTLANCYVGPRGDYDIDSIDGILSALVNQVKTLKSEGGWGENFSYIRPRGTFINGIGVDSPGAVKFMELFDKSSEIITAGSGKKSTNKKAKGKIRKGAMMGVLDIWHPDIIEFITAKQQANRLSKFNISVNVSDAFMSKVNEIDKIKSDAAAEKIFSIDADIEIDAIDKWDLVYPDTTFTQYKPEWDGDIKLWQDKGYPVIVYNTVKVSWLWNLIMESTYNRAEPGVLFLDRANHFNPLSYGEKISSTNPCGEQVLSPGNICCLGTINLTQFLNADYTGFDLVKLAKYVGYMVRFLDNVNSYSAAPLPEYKESMEKKRRIGCGVMGWGSALMMMQVRFGSEPADKIRTELMNVYAKAAYMASIDLAVEKGMFEYCIPEKHAEAVFVKSLNLPAEYMDKLRTTGIRNAALMSQQPNGNGSIFANVVTGGIEPAFMAEYIRTVIVGNMPEDIAHSCPKWFEGEWYETDIFKITKEGDEEILKGSFNGVTYKIDKNRGLTKEVLCEDYGVRNLKKRGLWNPNADWAVTTTELSADDHVNDLKGFAKMTDSACSKTCNLPYDYPLDKFKTLYKDVYNTGYIKGFTTYRSGTMTSVLSAIDSPESVETEEIILDDVKLAASLPATVKTLKAEGKKYYLTVINDETNTRPVAFFVHTNHHEKTVTTSDAIDRLLQLAQDKCIPQKHIDAMVAKYVNDNNVTKIARTISLLLRHGVLIKNVVTCIDKVHDVYVGSFLFAIKKFLATFIKDGEKVDGACESCGGKMVFSEGCSKCISCGSSKCG